MTPGPATLGAPPHNIRRRHLFIDAQHGLCNRLRALASASAIAEATDRRLMIIWRTDPHCEARIFDIFDYPGPVIEEDNFAETCRARAGIVYNYMEVEEDSCFATPVLPDAALHQHQDVYIRSAYLLNSPHQSLAAQHRFLRSLTPARPVLDLIAGVHQPNDIALHIRVGTGKGYEHLEYENADGNWPEDRHREILEWRSKSQPDRFMARMDALLAQKQADTFFLAADTPETYAILKDRYGARLSWLQRDLFDRSAAQLQYALADLILLSAARRLLASNWSSFSDMAQYLARPGRPIERSGLDF